MDYLLETLEYLTKLQQSYIENSDAILSGHNIVLEKLIEKVTEKILNYEQ